MPKPKLSLRDWLFGAGGKRRLLEALLASPNARWTQAELARAAGVHPKGSIDEHVRALVQLGVLDEYADGLGIVPGHPLVQPLTLVVGVLSRIENAELERPP